jgi:hypothetical protein
MAYLAALSLSRGWRTGLAAVAGVAIGLSVYGVAVRARRRGRHRKLHVSLRDAAMGRSRLSALAPWDAWSTADDIAAEDMPSDHDELSRRSVAASSPTC